MVITGHFFPAYGIVPSWAPSETFGPTRYCVPSPANGYYYETIGGGTTGATQPAFSTIPGSTTAADGSVSGWLCIGPLLGLQLPAWDQEQSQTIDGDNGGCWSPQTPITFHTTGGGRVVVTGPTQVTNSGVLLVASAATIQLGAGDYPRNSPTHMGRRRRIVTSVSKARGNSAFGLRPDFAIRATAAVACALTYYVASVDDSTVTTSTVPVTWWLPLDVHNTGTFEDVVLTYRANLGTPRARVIAISATGVVTPLTSEANGADANGFVSPPAVVVTDVVQRWTIPIDGGASSANAVIARDSNSYVLQVIEDATQTDYPGTLPVLTPVFCATTGPIDMALAPATIDGQTPFLGARVLVKNQTNPNENGIYLYQGAGQAFTTATFTPIPEWAPGAAYVAGTIVQGLILNQYPFPYYSLNGLSYQAGPVAGSHTAATTPPAWPTVIGQTVIDNPGANQVTWTCIGPTDPYTYKSVVEIRTFGLLQGSVVNVQNGTVNSATYWQYTGTTIAPADLGNVPALGWYTIPTGLVSNTITDVSQQGAGIFAAQGNAYHAAACDFANIATQAFQ
jgi:hypothetical protein